MPFSAKFSGMTCGRCSEPILQKQSIDFRPTFMRTQEKYVHALCPNMSNAEADCINMGLATPRS